MNFEQVVCVGFLVLMLSVAGLSAIAYSLELPQGLATSPAAVAQHLP